MRSDIETGLSGSLPVWNALDELDRRLLVEHAHALHMTHDEIARHMGSAREVVSRMLKYFQQEGIVDLSRGCITLLDRQRLHTIAS